MHWSSSAGDRELNITYNVQNGKIVSCTGTYNYPAEERMLANYTDHTNECNLTRLETNGYGVSLIVTSILSNNTVPKNLS